MNDKQWDKSSETYIDYICRIKPLRERALSGLGLKLISLRMQEKYSEEANVIKEYNRLLKMTDEEYADEVKKHE